IRSPELATRTAELDERAIGKHHFEGEDVVRRDAILETMRAAGILGDVPADGTGALTRRIGRVLQTVRFCRGAELRIDDAGLDDDQLLARAGKNHEIRNATVSVKTIHRVG